MARARLAAARRPVEGLRWAQEKGPAALGYSQAGGHVAAAQHASCWAWFPRRQQAY